MGTYNVKKKKKIDELLEERLKLDEDIQEYEIKMQCGGFRTNNEKLKAKIDWELFEKLCALQCTMKEICSMLGISIDCLYRRTYREYGEHFSEVYARFAKQGCCSLRRMQFVMAKTNPTMAIWLGKNWLGQSDEVKNSQTAEEQKELLEKCMKMVTDLQKAQQANDRVFEDEK